MWMDFIDLRRNKEERCVSARGEVEGCRIWRAVTTLFVQEHFQERKNFRDSDLAGKTSLGKKKIIAM